MTGMVKKLLEASTGREKRPPDIVAEVIGAVEQLERDAKASVTITARHNRKKKWDAARKKRKRAEARAKKRHPYLRGIVKDSVIKEDSIGGDLFGNRPDDWPEDFAAQFWDTWPRHNNKYDEPDVARRLTKIRKSGRWAWAQVFGGLKAYLATNPEPTWIPTPSNWIAKQRWQADYSKVLTSKRATFGDIMRGRSSDEPEQSASDATGTDVTRSGR